jgi:hypothetical protein
MPAEIAVTSNVKQAVPFFNVRDIEASLRFYVDGLGCVMTRQWLQEGRVRWCWLRLGDAALMLQDAFDDMMVYFWTAVCTFILGLACRVWKDDQALAWVLTQWNTDFPALYKLRSVGQHYGMDTGLLDATSSWRVALWFATHDFATGAFRRNETAVLYRIDRTQLARVEAWVRAIPEHGGEFDAASIDIGDTPATIAARASRQHGWSLVGWDHPRLLTRMVAEGLLTRYDFRTGASPQAANAVTRDDLLPIADPAAILFRIYWSDQPRSLEAAQAWIDTNWNIATSERLVLDQDGEWFTRLAAQIDEVYAVHTQIVRDALAGLI